MRTAKGKLIKTHYMHNQVEPGVGEAIDDVTSWLLQQDITIIGASLRSMAHAGGTPAYQEGDLVCAGTFSRAGVPAHDGEFCRVRSTFNHWTEIVVATQTAGVYGEVNNTSVVMFPEGYGIDVDDGEYVYLHNHAVCHILSAGNAECAVDGVILYVER